MVEGVVEVEAVTYCAGDAACPIAVASAVGRKGSNIDSCGRRRLGQRRTVVHCHFVETNAFRAVQAVPYSKKRGMLYFVYNVYRTRCYRTWPPPGQELPGADPR